MIIVKLNARLFKFFNLINCKQLLLLNNQQTIIDVINISKVDFHVKNRNLVLRISFVQLFILLVSCLFFYCKK